MFRLFTVAKRRLLWRVRRKLILSYIFIGFVPAILIVVFFLLCGLLLFFNFSSYLVQTEVRALDDQARFLAPSAALEIQRGGGRDVADVLNRKRASGATQLAGASMAVVPVERPCARSTLKAQASAPRTFRLQTSDFRLPCGPMDPRGPAGDPAGVDRLRRVRGPAGVFARGDVRRTGRGDGPCRARGGVSRRGRRPATPSSSTCRWTMT